MQPRCALRCARRKARKGRQACRFRRVVKNIKMEQIQPVCLAQIAQELGVAPSTVSRALRGDPRIGEATTRRVQEIVRRLGYQPNPLVSALMAHRRRGGAAAKAAEGADVMALVTSYGPPEDWRTKEVCRWEFEGIRQRARELGFRVEVFSVQDYGGETARLETTLRARGIRGVLLGFSRENGEGSAPGFLEGFAVAGLSAYFPRTTVHRANFHGFFNVQMALDHMRCAGYRRPALVVPELNNRISNNLWSGAFLDWQRQLLPADRCEPFIPAEVGGSGLGAFDAWLDRNGPDALLVYKVAVRPLLAARGWRVPEDMGLAYLYRTSDEMGAAAGVDGNLSAVGAAAVDLVVERLYSNQFGVCEHPKEVLIKGVWHDGVTLPTRGTSVPETSRAPHLGQVSAQVPQ